jgi:hypothetical protein
MVLTSWVVYPLLLLVYSIFLGISRIAHSSAALAAFSNAAVTIQNANPPNPAKMIHHI